MIDITNFPEGDIPSYLLVTTPANEEKIVETEILIHLSRHRILSVEKLVNDLNHRYRAKALQLIRQNPNGIAISRLRQYFLDGRRLADNLRVLHKNGYIRVENWRCWPNRDMKCRGAART